LFLFDIIPLTEFLKGKGKLTQTQRAEQLADFDARLFADIECVQVVTQLLVNFDTAEGQRAFADYNRQAIDRGFEGVMIKDPSAVYECKRSTAWLKAKPFIEVTLEVVAVEEGTGRNEGRLGALVCEGVDDGKHIHVNVGSGLSDEQRTEFWNNQNSVLTQLVEVRADAITQNQDGTYSLRFPRFKTFRGFEAGEKI
jgi:DNA ligase-1